MKNLLIRTLSGTVYIALILFSVLLGKITFFVFILTLNIIALIEFYTLFKSANYTLNKVEGKNIRLSSHILYVDQDSFISFSIYDSFDVLVKFAMDIRVSLNSLSIFNIFLDWILSSSGRIDLLINFSSI